MHGSVPTDKHLYDTIQKRISEEFTDTSDEDDGKISLSASWCKYQ